MWVVEYWTSMVGRVWDFILWFANFIVTTVANSIFGGWMAVLALAGAALVLFLLTRMLFHQRGG